MPGVPGVIPRRYTEEEDEIILYYTKSDRRTISEHCRYISKHHLPHRDPHDIRTRWRLLMDKLQWQPELKDVADLLSPEQKKRIRTRIPSFKNIKVIR